MLKQRASHPGLVWIFSALEPCTTYGPRIHTGGKRPLLVAKDKKCLHDYFSFIDEIFGLCSLRVPTWAPFRRQFSGNLHHRLARQLDQEGIDHRLLDNAYVRIQDWARAQQMADGFQVARLHEALRQWVQRYCPMLNQLEENDHWTIDTAEYATDVMFHWQRDRQHFDPEWVRTAIHTVKSKDMATWLGRKWTGTDPGEAGNRYNTPRDGTRLRHGMGMVSIERYDQFGQILRIEITVKDITCFRHYRAVEQRDGNTVHKYAPRRKTIYKS